MPTITARSPWRDPSSYRVAIAFSILAALANGVWLLLDHSAPSWDQSHYLSVSLQYQHSFEVGGPIEFLRAVYHTDPSHGPLYTVALTPFIAIFGASARSGLILNLIAAPFLYFCAGEIAWIVFERWSARLLTIVLVATMPLMTGLFHNVLQDFLLVTLATASVLLLLKTEGFQRRGYTIAMAVMMGLGTLNKVTFPAFVAGPVIVVVAQACTSLISGREELGEVAVDRRRLALNLGIALACFLVISLAWYGPTAHETLAYVRSTTSGPLSEGAGPSDPLTFHALAAFTTGVVNFNLSWVILLLGLLAVALDWSQLVALFRRPVRAAPLWALALLLTWVLIPYLSVALAHNQDVRLMAPALPGVAVLVAGAVSRIRWHRVAAAAATTAVLVLVYQSVNHVTDITPGGVTEAKAELGEYAQVVQLNSVPIGYEQLPRPDYATPVIEYIEGVAAAEPGGLSKPRSICMLESEATMNSNTLGFLIAARGDPFALVDVVAEPGHLGELKKILGGCDFAIYVPQPKIRVGGQDSRLAIVNAPYAANHMTPSLFALFKGPSRSFPLPETAASEEEPGFLSAAGGTRARVLVRPPGR